MLSITYSPLIYWGVMKRRNKKPSGYLTWDILKRIIRKHDGQIRIRELYVILASRGYLVWGADIRDALITFEEQGLIAYSQDRDRIILTLLKQSKSDNKIEKEETMTRGELLNYLTEEAKRYRKDALSSIQRNGHMHRLFQKDIAELCKDPERLQRFVDALLVDFINYVGTGQCLDYGLHTKHIET